MHGYDLNPSTDPRWERLTRLATADLKVCPLCGGLNAFVNLECFVCRWRGDFVHDSDSIEYALVELMEQAPDLGDLMPYLAPEKLTWRHRIMVWVRKVFRRRVNLQV